MINPRRGEIEAVLGGRQFRLCLTLGALAELEHVFAAEDLSALARRLADGRLSARDALRIIAAGIRGGGSELGDPQIAGLAAEGGAAGYVDIVARLLRATFGDPGGCDEGERP